MISEEIISKLPFSQPFLFVDEIESISENGVRGNYTFPADSFFYKGHFENNPVTPGVILTECLAQIGLVSLGIFLLGNNVATNENPPFQIALSSTKMEFYHPVFPSEKVIVVSEKIYFRFNKLKCSVKMYDEKEKMLCSGEISGMMKQI